MLDNKILKKIISSVLVVIFTIAMCMYDTIEIHAIADIATSRQKQAEIRKESEELKKQLGEVRQTMRQQEKYKATLQSQIEAVKREVDLSNEIIAGFDEKIAEQQKLLDEKQDQISRDIEILKKRLRATYMEDDVSAIDIILGAKDFSDFFDRIEIAQCMADKDDKIISKLQKDREIIETQKAEIEESKKSTQEELNCRDQKREELKSLIDENEKLIKQSKESAENLQDEIDQNDEEFKRIDREIVAYYKSLQKNGASSEKSTSKDSGKAKGTGTYTWPVPGFHWISSSYYDTVNRGGKIHGAIDIAGRGIYGANVVAADGGKVIKINTSAWGGGYGNFIIIDHGNGKSTLYGHLSLKCVSVGQTVTKGQKIGNVGSTGFSTGPHLHFETRLNGIRYNPLTEVS